MCRYVKSLIATVMLLVSSPLFSFALPPEIHKIYETRISMSFATTKSDLEAYLYTDWSDPNTAKLEPILTQLAPEILKKSRLYFVDIPSDKTKDLTIANVTFLLGKNKNLEQYLKLRNVLVQLASKNPSTKSEEIKNGVKALGVDYQIPSENFLETALATVSMMNKSHKMDKKPTLFITNAKTHKRKSFEGIEAITPAAVLAAIEELQKP